jgi:hypothetical protein
MGTINLPDVANKLKHVVECRVYERRSCRLDASCQPVAACGEKGRNWSGQIRDISRGGMGLILNRRFERGACLAIEIAETERFPGETLLGRVVHATAQPDGRWLLGCQFFQPLSEDKVSLLTTPSPHETDTLNAVSLDEPPMPPMPPDHIHIADTSAVTEFDLALADKPTTIDLTGQELTHDETAEECTNTPPVSVAPPPMPAPSRNHLRCLAAGIAVGWLSLGTIGGILWLRSVGSQSKDGVNNPDMTRQAKNADDELMARLQKADEDLRQARKATETAQAQARAQTKQHQRQRAEAARLRDDALLALAKAQKERDTLSSAAKLARQERDRALDAEKEARSGLQKALAEIKQAIAGKQQALLDRQKALEAKENALRDRDAALARAQKQETEPMAAPANGVAQAVSAFWQNALLGQGGSLDPDQKLGVLQHAESSIGTQLKNQPLAEANVRLAMARAYRSMGETEKAQSMLEQVVRLREKHLGKNNAETLTAKHALAVLYQAAKKPEAEPLLRETVDGFRATFGNDHPDTLRVMRNLAVSYRSAGRYDQAEPLFAEVLAGRRRVLGADAPDTLSVMNELALLFHDQAKYDRAEALSRECLKALAFKHSESWLYYHTEAVLGASLLGKKDYAAAEPLLVHGYKGLARQADDSPARIWLGWLRDRIVTLYDESGQHDLVERWRRPQAD